MSADPYRGPDAPVDRATTRTPPSPRQRMVFALISATSSFLLLASLACGAMLQYFEMMVWKMYWFELFASGIISGLVGVAAYFLPGFVRSKAKASIFGGALGFALAVASINVWF